MTKSILVVPTNRKVESFLEAWEPWFISLWDKIIIVRDGPDWVLPNNDPYIQEYCWKDTWDGFDVRIFSKQDSAIRSFGYWKAYEQGADVIMTLDDDCFPVSTDPQQLWAGSPPVGPLESLNYHKTILTQGVPEFVSTVPETHIRGLPYLDKKSVPVHINIGLWKGVPDFDAVHQLSVAENNHGRIPQLQIPLGSSLVHPYQYVPMCGMNLAFRREATPLMYFPLMGHDTPYGRFDDIWCGVVAQKICKLLQWNIAVGRPYVFHSRASEPFSNLIKEAPGLKANEALWNLVKDYEFRSPGNEPMTALSLMKKVPAMYLTREFIEVLGEYYCQSLAVAIESWCSLFEE